MTIITLCISISLFLFIPYYLNVKKLKHSNSKILVLSLLESISTIALAFLVFLQGFFATKIQIVLAFAVFLLAGLIYTYMVKDIEKEWDMQNENIKNSMIIFTLSIFSFMIGMTMFRFLNPFIQILLTILFICLVNLASVFFKKWFKPLLNKIITYFSLMNTFKYFLLMIVVAIVGFFLFVYRLPMDSLKENLNLLDNTPYLAIEGFPTDIQNDFRNEIILEIETDVEFRNTIIDYYYDDDYLYVYDKISINIYDLNQNTLINTYELPNFNSNLDISSFPGLNNYFFKYNDELFLLGAQALFIVSPTEISDAFGDVNYYTSRNFIYNDELYFYRKLTTTDFIIYKYIDGNLDTNNEINNSVTNEDEFYVISNKLFSLENDKYVVYGDSSKSFDYYKGTVIYNESESEMYYAYSVPELGYTRYVEVKSTGEINDYSISRARNSDMILVNDYIFLTEFNDIYNTTIEIINPDFEIYGVKNFTKKVSVYIQNDYYNQYIANFHSSENNLEYLRVDINRNHTILTLNNVYQDDVVINLPFYTHFGFGYLFLIIIAMFVPVTNYRKYLTIVGFDEMTKSKKEDAND